VSAKPAAQPRAPHAANHSLAAARPSAAWYEARPPQAAPSTTVSYERAPIGPFVAVSWASGRLLRQTPQISVAVPWYKEFVCIWVTWCLFCSETEHTLTHFQFIDPPLPWRLLKAFKAEPLCMPLQQHLLITAQTTSALGANLPHKPLSCATCKAHLSSIATLETLQANSAMCEVQ
jgi:hypothetical protein